MARQLIAILAAAAAAAAAFGGVSAGPCKPVSSLALSSTIIFETTATATSHETASSTITADVTETETTGAFEATITEGTTDATGTTDVVDTTVTESATDTATTGSITTFLTTTTTEQSPEQSTTTTAGPVGPGPSLEEQILYNPSFDDNIDGWPPAFPLLLPVSCPFPYDSSINYTDSEGTSLNTLTSGSPSTTFSQALPALGDYEYELVYYISMQNPTNGFDFLCYANAFVNGKQLRDSPNFASDGPFTYQRASEVFTPQNSDDAGELHFEIQCGGEFQSVKMAIDDVSLTRRCGV